MKNIAKLLFEAHILKEIPRSGYQFLGAGKESVHDWLSHVLKRLKTETGKNIAQSIMETNRDEWWLARIQQ